MLISLTFMNQNRQSLSKLGNSKVPFVQSVSTQINGKENVMNRGENNVVLKDTSSGTLANNNSSDIFKVFSSLFVRLNGILYTRTR